MSKTPLNVEEVSEKLEALSKAFNEELRKLRKLTRSSEVLEEFNSALLSAQDEAHATTFEAIEVLKNVDWEEYADEH